MERERNRERDRNREEAFQMREELHMSSPGCKAVELKGPEG